MEKSELLSVKEASELLGISPATVKNWIKLGKLQGRQNGASFLLSKDVVDEKSRELLSSSALRSRRNKSRFTTNFIPKSYISNTSPNYKTIKNLVMCQELSNYSSSHILTYYAKSLMDKAGISPDISKKLLTSLTKDTTPSYDSVSERVSETLGEYPLSLLPGEDTLGMLYLSLRSMQDKKSTGAYYTPFFVVDRLIENALEVLDKNTLKDKHILDPACGTGNFLLRLPDYMPLSDIHGYDIDPMAIFLTRINLAIKYKVTTEKELTQILSNIAPLDFLFESSFPGKDFDIVIGNPPWGYVFTSAQNKLIKKSFKSFDGSGMPESFSLFIEKALGCGQNVTFLLPETILSSDYHQGIREFIMSTGNVQEISYLGEAFDKVQCPSIILGLTKNMNQQTIKTAFYKKDFRGTRSLNKQKSFEVEKNRITADDFNILADQQEYEIIQKMSATPHFTLEGNCDFALGIVSGANKSLLLDHKSAGTEPIIKGKDISKYHIEVGKAFTIFNPDRFQQVAPEKFYRAKDKLFYRFIAPEPIIALDRDGLISLNSANIMIPHIKGYSNAYIMAVLNSKAMSFYYRHTCKNMKVLRSSLERLPIPYCDDVKRQAITDLACRLSKLNKTDDKLYKELVFKLDYLVFSLYNLDTDEIENIMK